MIPVLSFCVMGPLLLYFCCTGMIHTFKTCNSEVQNNFFRHFNSIWAYLCTLCFSIGDKKFSIFSDNNISRFIVCFLPVSWCTCMAINVSVQQAPQEEGG